MFHLPFCRFSANFTLPPLYMQILLSAVSSAHIFHRRNKNTAFENGYTKPCASHLRRLCIRYSFPHTHRKALFPLSLFRFLLLSVEIGQKNKGGKGKLLRTVVKSRVSLSDISYCYDAPHCVCCLSNRRSNNVRFCSSLFPCGIAFIAHRRHNEQFNAVCGDFSPPKSCSYV